MNPIDATFQRLRAGHQRAFIPFLVAGDPAVEATVEAARRLAAAGASVLEIGFPYSDPIADGPVIQAAYTRALGRGLKLDDVFACVARIATLPEVKDRGDPRSAAGHGVPVVGMMAYSLIYRRGAERFLDQAKVAGLSGLIVPDLPLEESGPLASLAAGRDLKLIQLVTPTTAPERAKRIAALSTGFLYCVSVAGITGERDKLPEELLQQLAWLRQQTPLPLCVGFGISKPEHARALRDHADGIIVGSAVVRALEQGPDAVRKLAEGLVAALA
jgi:tryptophan synthase alpha chain